VIDFIFTFDYEIYGNGDGNLQDLIVEPTERLIRLFKDFKAIFVVFAEAAEFEKIEEFKADQSIDEVRKQLRQLHQDGFEIALHIHPQWFNARREQDSWALDLKEYSLCNLTEERIDWMVHRSINYLRGVLGNAQYSPISFRAGNWIMQPTSTVAKVLYRNGIRLDSSVFKGGVQRQVGLDYRHALKNGPYWFFTEDVNRPDSSGVLLEVPICCELLPFWRMIKSKRLMVQRRNIMANRGSPLDSRLVDFARFKYPRKLDFCRMSWKEMRETIDRAIGEDRQSPDKYRPLVAIGHSKDLGDIDPIERLLCHLAQNSINISDFSQVLRQATFMRGASD